MENVIIFIMSIFTYLFLSVHSLKPPEILIQQYFKFLKIDNLMLLICWSEDDQTTLLRSLSSKGFILTYSDKNLPLTPVHRGGGVLDLNCLGTPQILKKFTEQRLFGVHTEWLFLDVVNSTNEFEVSDGVKSLDKAYILPSSRVTLAQITEDNDVAFYDAFRPNVYRPMVFELMAKQQLGHFEDLPSRSLKREDFQGITLTGSVALYHEDMFTGFDSYEHPEIDTIPKVNFPIIDTLSQQLNFSLALLIVDDYGWQKNMTFSGLMGLLQREEIDLGATGIFMRPDRIVTVDFTGDTFEIKCMKATRKETRDSVACYQAVSLKTTGRGGSHVSLLPSVSPVASLHGRKSPKVINFSPLIGKKISKLIFKQPALSSVSNIFVLPFTLMVWICCFSLTVITSALLVVDTVTTVGERTAFYEPVTSADIITTVIGCVCQQGTSISPKSGSAKLILFFFSLCTLFFYTSYSANIVALLQSTSPTIKTLADLTNSPLSVGVQDVIYNKIYFEEDMDKNIKDLYHKKVLPQGKKAFMSPEEGIKKVRSGLFAFTVETHWGYKIISDTFLENEKCGIDEIRLFLLPKMSIPVIKRSGYREIFTVKNTLQRDVGLHSRVKDRWLLTKPECDSRGRGYVSVGITDFKPALLVILYGFAISFAVFVAEIFVNYRERLLKKIKKKKTKNQQFWNDWDYYH